VATGAFFFSGSNQISNSKADTPSAIWQAVPATSCLLLSEGSDGQADEAARLLDSDFSVEITSWDFAEGFADGAADEGT